MQKDSFQRVAQATSLIKAALSSMHTAMSVLDQLTASH